MGAARTINKEEFDNEIIKSSAAVVDFGASWCGPCKALSPEIDKMAEEFNGKATIVKVDVDDSAELASRYAVMSVPTVLFFQNGEKVDQISGNFPDRIRARINEMID